MSAIQEDAYYTSEQIKIPPALPDILKQFTKAAIRTQPKDALDWSHKYFKAMASGEIPPVKDRMEMPSATQKTDTGLSPGLLRVLNKQLGPKKTVELSLIQDRWKALSLPIEIFQELCQLGNFVGSVDWIQFFSLATCYLCGDLTDSLKMLCELLTADPEGGPSRVNFDLWKTMFLFLAKIDDKIPADTIDRVLTYLAADVERQGGMIQPSNFLHPDCPKLKTANEG